MVQAARGLVPVLVDCTRRDAHAELRQRYGVTGYPTVLFLTSRGEPIAALGRRDPEAVKAQFETIAREHGPRRPARQPGAGGQPEQPEPPAPSAPGARVKVVDATIAEGLEQARAEGKLLALIFAEPEGRRRDEQTEQVVVALRGRGMDQLPERFHWVRRPLCDDIGMNTPEADAYQCRRAPTIVLLDPWAEAPRGRPHPALGTKDALGELRAALERASIEAARAGHPPPAPRRP